MEEKMVKQDILLIGKTGNGKSATGNTILGRKAFKTSASVTSVTKDVECGFAHTKDCIIKVVDGPGLGDCYSNIELENETKADNLMKVLKALSMCNGTVSAFVLVIRFGFRFTSEDKFNLESLKQIFGHGYLGHTIVVMTGGDLFHEVMEEEGVNTSFHDWCREQTGAFQDLYSECAGRFVLFNNREKDETKKLAQRKDLISLIDALRAKHGRYSSGNLKIAKEVRERMELQAPVLKESIQRKINFLTAEIEHLYKNPSDSAKKQIQESIQGLRDEIEAQGKGDYQVENLRKLVDKMEQYLDDVSILHDLSEEIENIRKAKIMWSLIGSSFTVAGGALGLLVPFVGAIVSVASLLSTFAGCMQIGSKEKEIQNSQKEIIEQRLKPQGLFQENKELEEQERNKDD